MGIGPDKYNHIFFYASAKEMWDYLKTAYEGMSQIEESKVDMLTTQYEAFSMNESEKI